VPVVDTHAHCYDLGSQAFNARSGFHVQDNERGSFTDYRAVLAAHNVSHAVLVNPLGGYGVDNTYLLKALAEGGRRFKGIALLPEFPNDALVRRLYDGGVVGIRFNLNFPTSPPLLGAAGARALSIARDVDWLVQVHYAGTTLVDALPALQNVKRLVIDHCGRPDVGLGIDQPGFAELLALGREGRAYIKLSSFFRMSATGWPYDDCTPFVTALIEAFTIERCLWGSDWPFVRSVRRIDYGPQLAYLSKVLANEGDLHAVLWTNPARLFGFPCEDGPSAPGGSDTGGT